ncbi:protein YceG like protein [Clostridiaceae bacterium JG1575]|nr:protein YceG like protein [Clostridiaceae bacterium JG1575]
MKKVLITLIMVLLLVGGLLFGAWTMYHSNAAAPFAAGEPITVAVSANESLNELVDRLGRDGRLKNAWLSKLYYRLSGLDRSIRPGRHEAPAKTDLKGFLAALQTQSLDDITVTIPEGLTLEAVASRLDAAKLFPKEEFLEAAEAFAAPEVIPAKGNRRHRLEGYLKPDTYTFSKGVAPREVLRVMSEAFQRDLRRLLAETGRHLSASEIDAVIVKASMIEGETNNREERAKVASVIENRLAQKMPLQLDATVLYALKTGPRELTYQDLEVQSPYNTYWVKGLPAGPICSPSTHSIRAALTPEKTAYIYYVLNPKTGKHFFTASYDEFLKKKDEFLGSHEAPPVSGDSSVPGPKNPHEGPKIFPGGLERKTP